MVDLAPFILICVLLVIALVTPFVLWHRRDIKRGEPWDADRAAKIYIGLIAGTFVASLGLASTPLVSVADEEPSPAPSERQSVASTSEAVAETAAPASDPPATPVLDGDEIVLTDDRGVDLDTDDRRVLPTSGTPNLDVALNGSSLYTPSGAVFERSTTSPDESSCRAASADNYYDELAVGQWFCLETSDGATGAVRVIDVAEKSSGTEVTITVELFDAVGGQEDDSSDAEVAGNVTLSDDQGVDLDTGDRQVLPTSGTQGLDVGVNGSSLYTPDGTSFVRATTKPTRERCDALDGSSYYDDVTQGQWICFTTSEGVTGYLKITDVVEKAEGTEVSIDYLVFGTPSLIEGDDTEIDDATSGEVTLSDDQGVDLDTSDRQVLPTSGTQGLDVGVNGSSLYTPDGTSFVRATTKPPANAAKRSTAAATTTTSPRATGSASPPAKAVLAGHRSPPSPTVRTAPSSRSPTRCSTKLAGAAGATTSCCAPTTHRRPAHTRRRQPPTQGPTVMHAGRVGISAGDGGV